MKTKEFIKDFSFSTGKENRESIKEFIADGRKYYTFGVEQAITLVGNLIKETDGETSKNVLYIGMSRQHPNDTMCDLKVGYEYAQLNAFDKPIMRYEIQNGQNSGIIFKNFCRTIVDNMNKEFIRTKQEKEFICCNLNE